MDLSDYDKFDVREVQLEIIVHNYTGKQFRTRWLRLTATTASVQVTVFVATL